MFDKLQMKQGIFFPSLNYQPVVMSTMSCEPELTEAYMVVIFRNQILFIGG